MNEEKIEVRLNKESAAEICKQLLEPFDKMPVESIPTVLNAFTMALSILAAHCKEETESDTEDHVERLILKWLCAVEHVGDMHFSKYIGTTAMTEQEIIMLGVAIDSHVKMLLNEEDAYKRNGNTEAIKECLDEVRRFKALKEKLENYGKDD